MFRRQNCRRKIPLPVTASLIYTKKTIDHFYSRFSGDGFRVVLHRKWRQQSTVSTRILDAFNL
ncbi:hypothetical protein BYT27DRAFT_7184908 [Phlegmacium glaucopus]|nr:hypothetical protein BYT27DRAFT_7184908 [Phlegmacium glaucopus]